jgi:hypothetical protein
VAALEKHLSGNAILMPLAEVSVSLSINELKIIILAGDYEPHWTVQ